MKEAAVTRFLAEQLNPERIRVNFNSYFVISSDKATKPEIFDPFHNIAHAFIVVKKLKGRFAIFISFETKSMGWEVFFDRGMKGGTGDMEFIEGAVEAPEGKEYSLPKAICIAAVRATATEQQIQEMGL